MADQQDDSLLERADSQETVVNVITPRRTPQSDLKVAGFILLACLLIAGQALTAYFVLNQKSKIGELEKNTDNLKLKLSHRADGPSASNMRLYFPKYKMPLLMDLSEDKKNTPIVKLADIAMVSLEKQVEDLLQVVQLPQFNETFLDNLKGLKKQMGSDWKDFESWMRYWLIFQMAQQNHPAPTPVPRAATTTKGESSLKTKCQLEAEGKGERTWLGGYYPQCDEQGNYNPMQCLHSTGYCWCVDKKGMEIPGTASRGRPSCGALSGIDADTISLPTRIFSGRMMAVPSLPKMKDKMDE